MGSRSIATYFNGKPTNKYGHDQRFLGKMLWPIVRTNVFVHDRYYWTAGIKSHTNEVSFEFGAGYTNEILVAAEAAAIGLVMPEIDTVASQGRSCGGPFRIAPLLSRTSRPHLEEEKKHNGLPPSRCGMVATHEHHHHDHFHPTTRSVPRCNCRCRA